MLPCCLLVVELVAFGQHFIQLQEVLGRMRAASEGSEVSGATVLLVVELVAFGQHFIQLQEVLGRMRATSEGSEVSGATVLLVVVLEVDFES